MPRFSGDFRSRMFCAATGNAPAITVMKIAR
jgi:hypothetical protein